MCIVFVAVFKYCVNFTKPQTSHVLLKTESEVVLFVVFFFFKSEVVVFCFVLFLK